MAVNLSGLLSDSMTLVIALIKDIEAAGSAGKALEAVISDEAVVKSLEALVKDLVG